MEKNEYVVVVNIEAGECIGTEFLGKVDTKCRAFHLIEDYSSKKAVSEEYGFPIKFEYDHVSKDFFLDARNKLVYTESHYLREHNSLSDPGIEASVHFYIFQV